MQGLLQIAGLPFVGSDTISSAASMDKAITKVMVEDARRYQSGGRCVCIYHQRYAKDPIRRTFEASHRTSNDTYPLFVKPANAGSSVGISKVKNAEELPKALETAFAED